MNISVDVSDTQVIVKARGSLVQHNYFEIMLLDIFQEFFISILDTCIYNLL